MRKGCIALVLIALIIVQGKAQTFFAPEVVINSYGVSEGATQELSELEVQLSDLLINYAPNVQITEIPKNPIRVFLLLNITAADGTEYIGDLELAMYRPIYGREEESLVYIVSQKEIRFRFQRNMSRGAFGRSLPDDPLQARVYIYSTLGLSYYYDSFSIYGGSPFLDYLEREQGRFNQILTNEIQSFSRSNSSMTPEKQIIELKSKWGEKFRELWYIYHRSGLDAEDRSKYGQSLFAVLSGLNSLREENASLSFFQFFSDTKRGEMRDYFNENIVHEGAKSLVDELFPGLLSRL